MQINHMIYCLDTEAIRMNSIRSFIFFYIFLKKVRKSLILSLFVQLSVQFYGDNHGLENSIEVGRRNQHDVHFSIPYFYILATRFPPAHQRYPCYHKYPECHKYPKNQKFLVPNYSVFPYPILLYIIK